LIILCEQKKKKTKKPIIYAVENNAVYDIIVVAVIKYVASGRPGRAAFKPETGRGMIYGRRTDTNGSFRPADQAQRPNLDPQIYGELCTRALAQTDYRVRACVRACLFYVL